MPMRLIHRRFVLMLGVSLAAACAGSNTQKPATQSAPSTAQAAQGQGCEECECGGDLRAANVAAEDTEDGAALTFTTREDKVADLRARVQHMAEMHERVQSGEAEPARTAQSDTHPGHHGMDAARMQGMPQQQEGLHTMQDGAPGPRPAMGMHDPGMVPSTVTVEEVPGGAKLRFTPRDRAKVDELRKHVHERAERMQEGGCDMMEPRQGAGSRVGAR